ncbi:Popeye domain-containing protein 3 [Lamellibrachia satsuma]|nr:Popeye domain-containing protein 3 [Lamellibrachia satsuma]
MWTSAQPQNETVEEMTSPDVIGCLSGWSSPHDGFFQLSHAIMFMSFLSSNTTRGLLFLHMSLVIAFVLLSTWTHTAICSPDIFSWNFAFIVINVVQSVSILYGIRRVHFPADLEQVYVDMFSPLGMSRSMFKKLVCSEHCTVMTLREGDSYATQELTRTNRLALLVSGTANVYTNNRLIHSVCRMQFLDSPEFEATQLGDQKFHVSIVAESHCRYVCWLRRSLEYLFASEPDLATLVKHAIHRDIVDKLYSLNDKGRTMEGDQQCRAERWRVTNSAGQNDGGWPTVQGRTMEGDQQCKAAGWRVTNSAGQNDGG